MVRPTLLKELMFSRIVATNQPFTSRLKRPVTYESVRPVLPRWISPPNLGIPGIQQLTIRGDPLTASFDAAVQVADHEAHDKNRSEPRKIPEMEHMVL